MSTINCHSDAQDRWHAEILYSLFKQKVTLAELQEMAAQVQRPPGTVLKNQRYCDILIPLDEQGAAGELPDLAERCAVLPELLEGGDSSDPETAIHHLHVQCIMQELIAEGYFERVGPRRFRRTDKVPPQSMRR
jgi:hypothetical protein